MRIMIKRPIVASYALLIFVFFPCSASGTTGLPGPGIGLSLLYLLALIPGALLPVAFGIKNNNSSIADALIIIVIFYTGVLGLAYFSSITDYWFSSDYALTTSVLLLLFTIPLLYYFIDDRRYRYFIISGTMIAFLVVNFFTPSIVNFNYYTFVDNEPLKEPNESFVKMVGLAGQFRHLKLSDGRILSFDKKIYGVSSSKQALVENVDADKFRVSFKGKASYFSRNEELLYIRNKNALFHIPLFETRINKFTVHELGIGRLVGEQEEKNINLYYATNVPRSRAGQCRTAEVESLLASGANPNYNPQLIPEGYKLHMAIEQASYHNCTDIIDLLIKSGANKHIIDSKGNTLLHIAVLILRTDRSIKTIDRVKFLIDEGVNIRIGNKKGDTALHIAAKYSSDVTTLLIKSGADINRINKEGETPLESAIKYHQRYGIRKDGKRNGELIMIRPEGKLIIAVLEKPPKKELKPKKM